MLGCGHFRYFHGLSLFSTRTRRSARLPGLDTLRPPPAVLYCHLLTWLQSQAISLFFHYVNDYLVVYQVSVYQVDRDITYNLDVVTLETM